MLARVVALGAAIARGDAIHEEASVKAIVRHEYGSPDVMKLEETPAPRPADDEVLVKILAAAANPSDWHLLRGDPFLIRLMGFGVRKPKTAVLGADIAGRVEAIGKNV